MAEETIGGGIVKYFVDTNFFLQCKKYDQINWGEITSDVNIDIYISRVVVKEIDSLKNDGKTKRAERAKKAYRLFGEMYSLESKAITKEINGKTITLHFQKGYKTSDLENYEEEFDLAKNDDFLLAGIKKYITGKQLYDTCFLTFDMGAILTCQETGIPVIQIPETWLLPVENDDTGKELIKLRERIAFLENKEPKIEIELVIKEVPLEEPNPTLTIKHYMNVKDEDLDEYVKTITDKFPMQTHFPTHSNRYDIVAAINRLEMKRYVPPSSDEIAKYQKEYKDWKESLRDFISKWPNSMNYLNNVIPFTLKVYNNGNVSVENLILRLQVVSGGLLEKPDFKESYKEHVRKRINYPSPPKAPPGVWANPLLPPFTGLESALKNFIPPINKMDVLLDSIRRSPDRYDFLWSNGKPENNMKKWEFHCQEFRHKTEPEIFDYFFLLDKEVEHEDFKFKVTVSGSNMSEPFEKLFVVHKNLEIIDPQKEMFEIYK
jgi:hypothetical protein